MLTLKVCLTKRADHANKVMDEPNKVQTKGKICHTLPLTKGRCKEGCGE